MSDQTTRDRIRAAILEAVADGATTAPLLVEEADNLAEHIERALFGDGSHEGSAAHWRANAAEEKRKKQHASGLLAEALREKAELEAALRDAQRGIAWLLVLAGGRVRIPASVMLGDFDGAEFVTWDDPVTSEKVLELRQAGQTATDRAQGESQPAGEHPGEIELEWY